MNDTDRISELESRVAFQEDALDKLNNVIAQQDRDILQLREMVKLLNKQLKQLDLSSIPSSNDDTPPPHY